MRETTWQIFYGDTVFTVKIVGVFKTEIHRGWKRDLTTWTCVYSAVNLTLTFATSTGDTTEMESRGKKDLHKT